MRRAQRDHWSEGPPRLLPRRSRSIFVVLAYPHATPRSRRRPRRPRRPHSGQPGQAERAAPRPIVEHPLLLQVLLFGYVLQMRHHRAGCALRRRAAHPASHASPRGVRRLRRRRRSRRRPRHRPRLATRRVLLGNAGSEEVAACREQLRRPLKGRGEQRGCERGRQQILKRRRGRSRANLRQAAGQVAREGALGADAQDAVGALVVGAVGGVKRRGCALLRRGLTAQREDQRARGHAGAAVRVFLPALEQR